MGAVVHGAIVRCPGSPVSGPAVLSLGSARNNASSAC
ncbi:hypothetical protein XHC_1939 [Xanthomonas hortorum pv. carotae str. M081]|nr:hypothetical protein XHC_1939 [Xanthomonas hortorum pv. carotae str. M081]